MIISPKTNTTRASSMSWVMYIQTSPKKRSKTLLRICWTAYKTGTQNRFAAQSATSAKASDRVHSTSHPITRDSFAQALPSQVGCTADRSEHRSAVWQVSTSHETWAPNHHNL